MSDREFNAELWQQWLANRIAEAGLSVEDIPAASHDALTAADVAKCLAAVEQPTPPMVIGLATALGVAHSEAWGAAGYHDLAATMSAVSAGIPKAGPLPYFTVTAEEMRAVETSDDPPQAFVELCRRRMVEEGFPLPGSADDES